MVTFFGRKKLSSRKGWRFGGGLLFGSGLQQIVGKIGFFGWREDGCAARSLLSLCPSKALPVRVELTGVGGLVGCGLECYGVQNGPR